MDITMGQYQDTGSMIHRITPVIKEYFLLVYIIAMFFASNFISITILGLTVYALIFVANLNIISVHLRYSRIIVLEIILALITMLFGGFISGLHLFLKLFLITMCSGLVMASTRPSELLFGLTKGFGLKNEYAMSVVIALTFLPGVTKEMHRIKLAQAGRGADLTYGSIIWKIRNIPATIIPLFKATVKRAEHLGDAMDVRCYDSDSKRTSIYDRPLESTDYMFIGAVAIIFILNIVLSILI